MFPKLMLWEQFFYISCCQLVVYVGDFAYICEEITNELTYIF